MYWFHAFYHGRSTSAGPNCVKNEKKWRKEEIKAKTIPVWPRSPHFCPFKIQERMLETPRDYKAQRIRGRCQAPRFLIRVWFRLNPNDMLGLGHYDLQSRTTCWGDFQWDSGRSRQMPYSQHSGSWISKTCQLPHVPCICVSFSVLLSFFGDSAETYRLTSDIWRGDAHAVLVPEARFTKTVQTRILHISL